MIKTVSFSGISASVVALTLVVALPAAPAVAEFQSNTSCLQGHVEARDYAELSENFRENSTDRRATLILNSVDEELTLKVLDLGGNSVCENVADLRTRCNWLLNPDDEFSVVIDNTTRDTETAYEVCKQ